MSISEDEYFKQLKKIADEVRTDLKNQYNSIDDKDHPNDISHHDQKVNEQNQKEERKRKTYTQEEINEHLKGYILVPKQLYDKVPYGAHIRFFKSDGQYYRHAYVKHRWIGKGGKKYFCFRTFKEDEETEYKYEWNMPYESINKLYKKLDENLSIEIYLMRNDILVLRKNNQELKSRIDKLEKIIENIIKNHK